VRGCTFRHRSTSRSLRKTICAHARLPSGSSAWHPAFMTSRSSLRASARIRTTRWSRLSGTRSCTWRSRPRLATGHSRVGSTKAWRCRLKRNGVSRVRCSCCSPPAAIPASRISSVCSTQRHNRRPLARTCLPRRWCRTSGNVMARRRRGPSSIASLVTRSSRRRSRWRRATPQTSLPPARGKSIDVGHVGFRS
jgi:hypothetical protein